MWVVCSLHYFISCRNLSERCLTALTYKPSLWTPINMITDWLSDSKIAGNFVLSLCRMLSIDIILRPRFGPQEWGRTCKVRPELELWIACVACRPGVGTWTQIMGWVSQNNKSFQSAYKLGTCTSLSSLLFCWAALCWCCQAYFIYFKSVTMLYYCRCHTVGVLELKS